MISREGFEIVPAQGPYHYPILARPPRQLNNEENSFWVTKQLKKALDPKDRGMMEV